jgi:hypothetical protein
MTVQMYSTLLAQLLGFWFILEFVVQMWERRRQGAVQPTGAGDKP